MLGRHFESVILYCVGQFKIEKMVFRAVDTIVFYHTRKTLGICSSSRNSMSLRLGCIFFLLCQKHAGSSSKIELVMEALCLHWKLRALFQRFSLVPLWDLSFWAKAIGLHFFKTYLRAAAPAAAPGKGTKHLSKLYFPPRIQGVLYAYITNMDNYIGKRKKKESHNFLIIVLSYPIIQSISCRKM
jgi:hypothetical protein